MVFLHRWMLCVGAPQSMAEAGRCGSESSVISVNKAGHWTWAWGELVVVVEGVGRFSNLGPAQDHLLGGSDEIKHVKNKKPTLVSNIFTKCF